jgi:hypothetical protein
MNKVLIAAFASGMMVLLLATAASAGGWAVVTLDSMPTGIIVDQPVSVGFTIRQHGITPLRSDGVRVRGVHEDGDSFVIKAKHDEAGHYNASLTFERAGKWHWAVASGLAPEWQPMPPLEVANSANAEVEFARAQSAPSYGAASNLFAMLPSLAMMGLGVLGLVGSTGGLVYWLRARRS